MKRIILTVLLVMGCKQRTAPPVTHDEALPALQLTHAASRDDANDSTRVAADDAWREGRLITARRGYTDLVARDPNDWRARAALASLDLAFGKLSVEAARALSREDLSPAAKDHVRALIAAAENPEHETLEGGDEDWDIDGLRTKGTNADDRWWLEKGRAASETWLFGLAVACFEEALSRSESLSVNPPRWAQAAGTQSDDYMRMLANALP